MSTAGSIVQVDFYEHDCLFIHVVFFQPSEAHLERTLQLSLSPRTCPLFLCVSREALLKTETLTPVKIRPL